MIRTSFKTLTFSKTCESPKTFCLACGFDGRHPDFWRFAILIPTVPKTNPERENHSLKSRVIFKFRGLPGVCSMGVL